MIKIAMVSGIRPETNYTAYLVEALQTAAGVPIPDLTGKDPGSAVSQDPRIEVYVYCEKDERNREASLKNLRLCWDRNWRYFFQVLSQAKKDRVDVLHFQHEINMFGGPRTAVLFPFLVLASHLLGFRPLVTIHAVVPRREFNRSFLEVFEWPKPSVTLPIVKIVFPIIYFLIGIFAKRIIVHSPGIKETLARDYKIDRNKVVVIPHGVPELVSGQLSDVSRQLLEELGDKKFLMYFGYLHRRKGLEYLIPAFKKVVEKNPELILVLAGGTILPNYARELQEQIDTLGMSNKVFITGFIKLPDLRYLLEKCQFVVLPAIYSIAASGPLAQVFAHEKAVIVSDLGVYGEEITNGVNGLLVKVGDSHDLFLKMQSLLDDLDLRHRLEEGSRSNREKRRWSVVAAQTAFVYRSVGTVGTALNELSS